METTQIADIKSLLKSALTSSLNYEEYKHLMQQLTDNNSTSGNEKSESLVEYTKLNNRRIKRWDKTLKLEESIIDRVKKYNKNTIWLVLTESWCGDAAHIIPVLNKIAQLNDKIELKLVSRDENEKLMDLFLTNGAKSIPKVIAIDQESFEVLYSFGPRPSSATQMVEKVKKQNGFLSPQFKQDLQMWYNRDKGKTIVTDIINLLQV